jgi:HlyD family secretion protein
MKKLIILIVVLAAVGVGAGAYYMRRGGPEPKVDTLQVTRGDVADVVPATGTLEAVTTVDVGTQVSGMVQELYADFNSIVRKGDVIARLDPSLIQTAIEVQRANVVRAQADLERLKVNLADSERKLEQARKMWEKQLIPKDQLDTAELNVNNAVSQIKSSEAGLVQARANLNTQEVNLGHTVIKSPIDGIVISRNVDPGQTVAASMSAPTLYVIAADLTKMQVIANIDEADVGRIRPAQPVTLRVDAYPNDTFRGSVAQVRLQPTTVQNVVTYSAVILVPNPERKLMPGMTGNVTVEIARRSNALRVPAAALRFRPTADHFTALNLPVPPEIANRGQGATASGRGRDSSTGRAQSSGDGRGGDGRIGGAPTPGGAPGTPAANAPPATTQPQASARPQGAQPPRPEQGRGATGSAPTATGSRSEGESRGGGDRARAEGEAGGGGRAEGAGREGGRFGGGRGGFDPNMTPEQREERRKRMEERLAQMTPDERERWQQRMREGSTREGGGRGQAPGQPATAPERESRQGGGRGGGQAADAGRIDASRGITQRASGGASIASGATTIDSLFAPVVFPQRPATLWLWVEKQLKPVRIRYGISDGTWTELIEGDLKEGQEVVTNITTGVEPRTTPGQGGSQNPLMGPQRGGRGGPGGPGGGGGGRGGGR